MAHAHPLRARARRAALRTAGRYAWPLGVFLLSRVVQLLLIYWMRPPHSGGVWDRLLAWDGGWFIRVARDGYPPGYSYDESGALTGNGFAFFPGYPTAIRAVHLVTGLGYENSSLVAGAIAGCAATLAVYALGARLYTHRVGVVLATLFCAQPMSVVLSMGYSEGLFVAFTAAALLAAHRNAWLVAGVLGLAAALTRPTGAAVGVALTVAALIRVARTDPVRIARTDPGGGTSPEATPEATPARPVRPPWRPFVGAAMALLGVPGYLLWVGARVGSLGAWFEIQTVGWGTTFDYGRSSGRFVLDALRTGDGWIQVSVAWFLIAAVALTVVAAVRRVWPPLLVYGTLALILVIGQGGYFHSKPRLLVPVLLVLVPPALALGRARTPVVVATLVGYAAFGLWYGSYLLTIWHYAV